MGDMSSRAKSACEVEAVLFDAVGTLIHPAKPVAEVYAAAGHRQGIDLHVDEIEIRFRKAFAKQEQRDTPWEDGRTSEAHERRRWHAIVADVFDRPKRLETIFEELWDYFAQDAAWRLDADAPEVIQRIRDSGRMVDVASNFDRRLRAIAKSFPPLDACRLFISSELGWRKPRRTFFRKIEAMLSVPASRLMMIGDDVTNDFRGARHASWQAVLLHRDDHTGSVTPDAMEATVVPRIDRLTNVLEMLDA